MSHTTHTITHMYRGKSSSNTFILHKIQSTLHVKYYFIILIHTTKVSKTTILYLQEN